MGLCAAKGFFPRRQGVQHESTSAARRRASVTFAVARIDKQRLAFVHAQPSCTGYFFRAWNAKLPFFVWVILEPMRGREALG